MSVVGIVAEYNPFHNGHLYHLDKSKILTQSNYTIVVMSPNFVQRGAPAISDKWTRTKMALLCGADLVIELPTPYATASAEFFSKAAISLLHHTGVVDYINFGSESNNITLLNQIANILSHEPNEFKQLLKENLNSGVNFPSARAKALIEYCHLVPNMSNLEAEIEKIIQAPNNILGIEYLKALNKLNSNIIPSTLQRKGSSYHNEHITGQNSSATAIRAEIHKGNWQSVAKTMPKNGYDLLHNGRHPIQKYVEYKDLSPFLCYRLLFSSTTELKTIMGITEGMENRILNIFQKTQHIDEMIPAIKSKRFTQTTIQRILLNIILQTTKKDFYEFELAGGPQYIRVLGFRKSSSHLLTKLKANATLPLVMNVNRDYLALPLLGQKMLDLEIRSTNVYASLQSSSNNCNFDLTHPLVIV